MGWLTGWQYRKSSSVSRPAGAVENYQIRLLVGESAGAFGVDLHCDGLCKSSFDDIRFTAADGVTNIPYFIESITGNTPHQIATILINVPLIETSASAVMMYFGNTDAASASNGLDTFPFFSHFPGTSIDINKWYHWLTGGISSVNNSILTISAPTGQYEGYGAKTKFGVNYAFRARIAASQDANANDVCFFGIDDRSADGIYIGAGNDHAQIRLGNTGKIYSCTRNGVYSQQARSDAISSAFMIVEIQRDSNAGVRFLLNDTLKQTITTNIPMDDCGVILYTNTATHSISCDWVYVRKYLATPPEIGAWSELEGMPNLQVSTQSPSSITSTSFQANGAIDDEGLLPVTRRGFCYMPGTFGEPTIADSVVDETGDFDPGSFYLTVSALTRDVNYRVRAFAENSDGIIYGAPTFTVTTLKTPPTVVTAKPVDVLSMSATFSGAILDTGGQDAFRRGFCFVQAALAEPTVADTVAALTGTFGAGGFSQRVSGLAQGKPYRVRAFAENTLGVGYGATQSFTTQDPSPSDAIRLCRVCEAMFMEDPALTIGEVSCPQCGSKMDEGQRKAKR